MHAERPMPPVNLLGLATALMSALAGGAVWALAALWRQELLAFLALPVGLLVGRVLASNGPRSTGFSALCAATFSLAASAYALWMIASGRVALLLGMRLTDILGAIGLDLAAAIAWARLTPLDIACIALAAIVAAVAAIWRPAQSTGPSKS